MTANHLVLIKTFCFVSFLASYRKFRKLLFGSNLSVIAFMRASFSMQVIFSYKMTFPIFFSISLTKGLKPLAYSLQGLIETVTPILLSDMNPSVHINQAASEFGFQACLNILAGFIYL